MAMFFDRDLLMKPLIQSSFSAPGFFKSLCSDDLPRSLISDAKDDGPTTLIGDSNAILYEILKVETTGG